MKRKNIIFITIMVGMFLILVSYKKYQEDQIVKKQQEDAEGNNVVNEDSPYKAFKSFMAADGKADVVIDINEKAEFRFAKMSNSDEYGEAEIKVESVELRYEPKEEDLENELFRDEIEGCANKDFFFFFEQEIRYLYVNFTLKNISESDKTFALNDCAVQNRLDNGVLQQCGDICYAKIIEENEITVVEHQGIDNSLNIKLEAGKEYHIEGVIMIIPGQIYDLYFVTEDDDKNYPNDQVAVNLDIALYETNECNPNDGVVSDYQKRDLKQLRIDAKRTSYSFFEEQNDTYNFTDNYFYEYGESVGRPYEQAEGEVIPGTELTVLESELVESMEELPDRFKDSKYLNGMLDVYEEELPYDRDEYRFVYTKLKLKQFSNLGITTVLVDNLWMYNRDKDNNLWVVGCPEDYYILSSTNEKQTIEHQEILMEQNEELVMEAVYIIVPDTVYDLYIYNNVTGMIYSGEAGEQGKTIYGAASLDITKYEKGGIKDEEAISN